MPPRLKKILIWSAVIIVFVAALVGAAILGVTMAHNDLPDSVPGEVREPYPVGIIVTVGDGEADPVYLAKDLQEIRNFWFAHPTAERRAAAETDDRITRVQEKIEVRTLRQDADVVEVDVLTGPAQGESWWIHLSQLPPQS